MAIYGPVRTTQRGDSLREDFFRLLQRSYLMSEKQGKGLAVYRSIASTVYRLCGEDWVQRTIFPAETALVRRFLAETKLLVANPESVLQASLMGNSWNWIANGILQTRLSRQDFTALCTVTGAENLRAAQATGRGVVLAHSHTLFTPLFWTWIAHEGISPGVTIWKWAWGKEADEQAVPRIRALETARKLHAAVATLREGGLAHILADGDNGRRGLVAPFYQRWRGFRPTFAELALTAGACVIPVAVRFSPDGGIRIEIGPPFTDSPSREDRAGRVRLLVRQYVRYLHQLWQTNPADVQWYLMKQHLALPAVRHRELSDQTSRELMADRNPG